MTTTPQLPWRVPVSIGDVPEAGLRVELKADEATCRALAEAAGVRDIASLKASFDVTRRGRNGLHVVGTVSAQVGQLCVVSLEPVVNEVNEAIDLVFAGDMATPARSLDISVDTADPPEPLVNGVVDLGAVATEFLILGIDPYPRKAGAAFVAPTDKKSPGGAFAALAAFKRSGSTD